MQQQQPTRLTDLDLTKRFNAKVEHLVRHPSKLNQCYVSFIELCIFYHKLNDENVVAIQKLQGMIKDRPVPVEDPNIDWDPEDPQLYGFMESFMNL
jgi:hypothetical protein